MKKGNIMYSDALSEIRWKISTARTVVLIIASALLVVATTTATINPSGITPKILLISSALSYASFITLLCVEAFIRKATLRRK